MTDHARYDLPTRPEPQAVSAAPASVCPDCGGRQWRRAMGAFAFACLVRDVRAQTAAHHGLVDRLTVRLAEMDKTIAGLKARVAELESSELLAARDAQTLHARIAKLERALAEAHVLLARLAEVHVLLARCP